MFYDDELTAVIVETGNGHTTYVPIKPIVDHLGLAWTGQQQRIQRDPILSEVALIVRIESENMAQSGEVQMSFVYLWISLTAFYLVFKLAG